MKALNTMKFVSNATVELTKYQDAIREAGTYEEVRDAGHRMLGYLGCMTTFLNSMICAENNDFTGDYGDVLDEWAASLYQTMADKAIEFNLGSEVVLKLLSMRDEYVH